MVTNSCLVRSGHYTLKHIDVVYADVYFKLVHTYFSSMSQKYLALLQLLVNVDVVMYTDEPEYACLTDLITPKGVE
ncbi:hypothetical protein VCHA34P112_80050 [Vibrio chagasii]|nr:hypothetical protein VCHA34P112_80050 [Vibrio chagasii]CAH7423581.1 hypothetical protein VCHA56P515_80149 [Vibrio chagasii]CAH7455244.1 hypothetical protein VCHA53O463_90136 [Vibrio chagasii]